jgi:hypothetical protein
VASFHTGASSLVALLTPDGYPLVTSLALLSTVCSGAAAWLSYGALRCLSVRSAVAASSTVVVFTATPVWRIANLPEPFALTLLLAAGVLLAAARIEQRRAREVAADREDERDVFVLGVLFGLGLCSHHMLVWMVPLGACALWRGSRSAGRGLRRFATGFAAGLLPLLYLLGAAWEGSPYDPWIPRTPIEFVRLLLRSDYGTLQLSRNGQDAYGDSLSYFAERLPGWLSWAFAAAAAAGGLWWWSGRCRDAPGRAFATAWSASFLCSSVLFLSLFGLRIESFIPSIIERFMWLGTWLLLLPMALALGLWTERLPRPRRSLRLFALVAAAIAHVSLQVETSDRRADTFYEDHVRAVFALAAQNGRAVVVSSDAETFGALYGQHVLGLGGPDFWLLNAAHWGRARFAQSTVARWGLPPESADQRLSSFVSGLVTRRGRVVVVDPPLPPRPAAFLHSFVLGPVTVLVDPQASLPTADELWAMNAAFFQGARLPRCVERGPSHPWSAALWQKYLDNVEALAGAFVAGGRDDLARRADELLHDLRVCDDGPEPPRDAE